MTREEFIEKFPVGSKVRKKYWINGDFLKVLGLGSYKFFAVSYYNTECSFNYNEDWLPYEDQKPQYKIMSPALVQTCVDQSDLSSDWYGSYGEAKSILGKKFHSWPATQVITIPKGTIFNFTEKDFEGNLISKGWDLAADVPFETPVQFKVEVENDN